HTDQLAVLHRPHELAQLDVERALTTSNSADGGLHALYVPAMVGPPDVDHVGKATAVLVVVVGDVGGEIGPAAVGLLERPVDLVAELGGAKQGLLAVLPIVGFQALGRLEAALVDQARAAALPEGA